MLPSTLGDLEAHCRNFLDHFSLEKLDDLPGLEELKSSGFYDKRSAISTITDIANNEEELNNENIDNEDENLDDFISNNN